ncbi:hypothetical protein BBJ28_00005643 [Nothophytophthora sp. Chile5]|nr:hypothetical protein BBJ28_00005643 [Nothophytophthora sp. Chile5]
MGFFDEQVGVKVPQVTVFFWVIKVLATTVGETFADFLNADAGLGLGGTSGVMLAIFLVALAVQLKLDFYFAPLYWFVIVAISTVGTLLTDNLTDNLNVPLAITTPIFFVLLLLVFFAWYRVEKSLSIHSIYTRRREAWYWLTVLVTFALGTAAGDLVGEKLNLGYGYSLVLFAGCIVLAGLLWWFHVINGVFGFWVVYILTRPLGASLGDLLSQNPADSVVSASGSGSGSGLGSSSGSQIGSLSASGSGSVGEALPSAWKAGLDLGTTVTSMIFLGLIAVLVLFLTITKKDKLKVEPGEVDAESGQAHGGVSSTTASYKAQRQKTSPPPTAELAMDQIKLVISGAGDKVAGAASDASKKMTSAAADASKKLASATGDGKTKNADAASNVDALTSTCPSLSKRQRMIGFASCFCLGYIVSFGSTFALIAGSDNGAKFGITYTLGNIIALCGSGFLVGPKQQVKLMMKPVRRVATFIYLIMIVTAPQLGLVVLLLVFIQFLAAVWYVSSPSRSFEYAVHEVVVTLT